MFSTFRQKLILGIYVFILLSIPIGAYLASEYQNISGSAKAQKPTVAPPIQIPPKPFTSPAKGLLNASAGMAGTDSAASPSALSSTTESTIANTYGPTLSLKANLQGRPANNQATKLFVGIMDGDLTSNPKFLLNFTVDLPASGEYSGLSLAGLTPGSRYTALLKGSAQIATASAFVMSPNVTHLNDDQPVNLLSGDLNDDNVVNSADYSIAQKALGTSPNSNTWNENADLNKDSLINAFDLAIISKNIGQVGASGAWTSPIPKVASSSASLAAPPVGGPLGSTNGYWVWVPK